jgi:hypothetical protein
VDQGGLTTRGRDQEGGTPPYGEPALWPPSDSLSVLVLRPGKNRSFGGRFVNRLVSEIT